MRITGWLTRLEILVFITTPLGPAVFSLECNGLLPQSVVSTTGSGTGYVMSVGGGCKCCLFLAIFLGLLYQKIITPFHGKMG
jgi:hypothetical protein